MNGKNQYQAVAFLLLILMALTIRINVESTNYCSPDSYYYLEVSKNIVNGIGPVGPKVTQSPFSSVNRGSYGFPESYEKEYFAVWPLGYPVCIAGISYITSLEPLWASKILNMILLVLDFYLLFLIFGEYSSLAIFSFGSYTMLEISSYTWSENLFIPFFLWMLLTLKNIRIKPTFSTKQVIFLCISIAGMCLSRYASVVFFLVPIYEGINYFIKKEKNRLKQIVFSVLISGLLFGIYLLINMKNTGFITGIPRMDTQSLTIKELIGNFFTGIYNQLHFIKQFRYSGTMDLIFYIISAIFQLVIMGYIGYKLRKIKIRKNTNTFNRVILYSGLFYLIFLIYITGTSNIDAFDYRTLMPFSFPMYLVLFSVLEERFTISESKNTIRLIKLFFLFSLVMNLPKKYILGVLFS